MIEDDTAALLLNANQDAAGILRFELRGWNPSLRSVMTEPTAPRLNKIPFLIGDLLLLAVAGWIVQQGPGPLGVWAGVIVAACAALGAWLAVMPFLVEFRAATKLAEAGELTNAVAQLKNLQQVNDQIAAATAQWQAVQEKSGQAVTAADDIAKRIASEAKAFSEFLQKANDNEKNILRTEAEKLRRGEAEWLQITVRLLDHVHALHQAGVRSGQRGLVEQLGQFQNACRDTARRMGLVAVTPVEGEPFSEKTHQLLEDAAKPGSGAKIAAVLATGYTFQGQMIRRPLVSLQQGVTEEAEPEPQLSFEEPARSGV